MLLQPCPPSPTPIPLNALDLILNNSLRSLNAANPKQPDADAPGAVYPDRLDGSNHMPQIIAPSITPTDSLDSWCVHAKSYLLSAHILLNFFFESEDRHLMFDQQNIDGLSKKANASEKPFARAAAAEMKPAQETVIF